MIVDSRRPGKTILARSAGVVSAAAGVATAAFIIANRLSATTVTDVPLAVLAVSFGRLAVTPAAVPA